MSLRSLLVVLTASLGVVQAQEFQSMEVYARPGCREDSADFLRHTINFPVDTQNTCQTAFTRLDPSWPTDAAGNYIIYYNGRGIGDGCTASIAERSDRDPTLCGRPLNNIRGAFPGPCVEGTLPPNYASALCCRGFDTCVNLFPGGPAAQRETLSEVADNSADNSTELPRDVAAIKRSPIHRKLEARQDECRFEAFGDPFPSESPPEVVSNEIVCEQGTTCTFTDATAVTIGSSQSFAAGASAGTSDLWSFIQLEVSFTYTYEFSEATTETVTEAVGYPPGSTGVIIWTTFTECVEGQFVGNCPDITTNQAGRACIPVNTLPRGRRSFLRQG